MSVRRWVLLAWIGLIGCRAHGPSAPRTQRIFAAWPAPTRIPIAERKYDELHKLFELDDTPALWAPSVEDEAATSYRAVLTARLGDLSPRTLLERQRAHSDLEGWPGEEVNTAAVLEGKAGAFATPSCIERVLFARQASRYPLVEHPTEFGAFLLRGQGRVGVYFSSMDRVGQKIWREVTERVADDTKNGFRLVAHLHGHPFLLDRNVGDRM